jgi:hypothetical protein
MIRLLQSGPFGPMSIQAICILWTRASAAMLALWVWPMAPADSWIAELGIASFLILLLVGGIVLLTAAIRDLVRDFRHFLDSRPEKKGHAPS